jgi:hypothetical protein
MCQQDTVFLLSHLKDNFGMYYRLSIDVLRMGYNNLDRCVDFLQKPAEQRNWQDVKIFIFDAPQATEKSYVQRLQMLHTSTVFFRLL